MQSGGPLGHQVGDPYAPPRSDTEVAGPGGRGATPSAEEIAVFVGRNAGYYQSVWARPRPDGAFYAGVNVAAYIGAPWLLYRRMYLAALALLGAQIAGMYAAFTAWRFLGEKAVLAAWIVALTTKLGVAFLANGLYLRRARGAARAARLTSDGPLNVAYLGGRGGTNRIAAGLGALPTVSCDLILVLWTLASLIDV